MRRLHCVAVGRSHIGSGRCDAVLEANYRHAGPDEVDAFEELDLDTAGPRSEPSSRRRRPIRSTAEIGVLPLLQRMPVANLCIGPCLASAYHPPS